eukprot:gene10279-biopygen6276
MPLCNLHASMEVKGTLRAPKKARESHPAKGHTGWSEERGRWSEGGGARAEERGRWGEGGGGEGHHPAAARARGWRCWAPARSGHGRRWSTSPPRGCTCTSSVAHQPHGVHVWVGECRPAHRMDTGTGWGCAQCREPPFA